MDKKILIVDDDPAIVELLQITLEKAGFKTDSAYDGAEAVEKVKQGKPALVLLDIMLPTMDGYSVMDELRSSQEFKILPIVIISAKVREVDVSFGLEKGANDYFTKPLDLEKLVLRVKELLQG